MPFLSPFLVGRVPLLKRNLQKKGGHPYSNLSNLEDLVKVVDSD